MPLIDSHCHLQAQAFSGITGDVISRALAAGIEGFVSCSTSTQDWEAVTDLANSYPSIIPAYGVHPWYIERADSNWEDMLKEKLNANPKALVGEIGLDFEKFHSTFDVQEKILEKQLAISRELRRPASIHCRKAWHRLMRLLIKYSGSSTIAIHSFSGSKELVESLSSIPGLYFSFSASITNHSNIKIAQTILATPIDKILIESDAPDIMPFTGAGRLPYPNEPANAMLVLERIAEIRKIPLTEIMDIISGNSGRYLGRVEISH